MAKYADPELKIQDCPRLFFKKLIIYIYNNDHFSQLLFTGTITLIYIVEFMKKIDGSKPLKSE